MLTLFNFNGQDQSVLNFLKEELEMFGEISEPLMQFFSFLELFLVGVCHENRCFKMWPCFDFDTLLMKY